MDVQRVACIVPSDALLLQPQVLTHRILLERAVHIRFAGAQQRGGGTEGRWANFPAQGAQRWPINDWKAMAGTLPLFSSAGRP